MFIKRSGRRCLLLHSVRDGSGKVGHRRLGHFWDAASLGRCLAALLQGSPEFKPDIERIRRKAHEKLNVEPFPPRAESDQRVDKFRRFVRSLLTLLAEEDDSQVIQAIMPDLDKLRVRLAHFEG